MSHGQVENNNGNGSEPSVQDLGEVTIHGKLIGAGDISALAVYEDELLIGSDEEDSEDRNFIQRLRREADGSYTIEENIVVSEGGELDLEGIAVDGKSVYVIGSHSLARKSVKLEDTATEYQKNRERIAKVEKQSKVATRSKIIRLRFNGASVSRKEISLRDILEGDEVLGRFTSIPSKENGVDIEGLAVFDNELYVGFRGPVLRDNWACVMVLKFNHPDEYDLRFVPLDGNGVRDIVRVQDGFLILSGPVGDSPRTYRLYHWDGLDCIPGLNSPGGSVRLLGLIPAVESGAEGLAVLSEDKSRYEVLVVYDGVEGGRPTKFSVRKNG